MQVIIVGGGIAGSSAALSLHQIGVDCRIYEAVARLEPVGHGINLQPNAVRELTALGLGEELARRGHPHRRTRLLQQARAADLDRAARQGRGLQLAADLDLARQAAGNPARGHP